MQRIDFKEKIENAFMINPAVTLIGPRQCGKTTLARSFIENIADFNPENYFDLERPSHTARLTQAEVTLANLKGLIVLDEIQRIPDLFPLLRSLIDEPDLHQHYLILGSASGKLLAQTSESLAGRISYIELTPFNLQETQDLHKLWLRGGFPKSFLAPTDESSLNWREHYIRTYLEQDLAALGLQLSTNNIRRLWYMLAHYHGNILNYSELGRSLGLSHNTIRHYIDILAQTFMLRPLQPWFANIKKRQVKSPKIYFKDSGILHTMLGVQNHSQLMVHPKVGASWEGFALEEIIRKHAARSEDCYFWATHNKAELDLLMLSQGKRLGFEFKYTSAPKLTHSMHQACEILELDSLTVIYPGSYAFSLTETIRACGLERYCGSC